MAWILLSGPKGTGRFKFAGTFGYYDEAEGEAKALEAKGEDCRVHRMIDDPQYETEGTDDEA